MVVMISKGPIGPVQWLPNSDWTHLRAACGVYSLLNTCAYPRTRPSVILRYIACLSKFVVPESTLNMTTGEACILEKRGNSCILIMNGNGEHRLSPGYIDSLLSALAEVNHRYHEASALITTNEGKFFSNGLDLDWVSAGLGNKETRWQQLGTKLRELVRAVMSLKLPTIAAVCGHACAGGFIFALAHDYIFMRKDRGFLYMSEVDVGIIIPPDIMSVIRSKLNSRQLREVVLGGRKFTAQMALDEGLVDSAHDSSAETLDAAISAAIRLGRRNWNKELHLALRLQTFPEATEMLHLEGGHPLPSRL